MVKSSIQILAAGFAYGTAALLISLAAFVAVIVWAMTRSRSEIAEQTRLAMDDGDRLNIEP